MPYATVRKHKDQVHQDCPDCGSRLARSRLATGAPVVPGVEVPVIVAGQRGSAVVTTLETRYTDAPHDRYPHGSYWRQSDGGYKGMARARDLKRMAAGRPLSATEEKIVLAHGPERRDREGVTLPIGEFTVVCYGKKGNCETRITVRSPRSLADL